MRHEITLTDAEASALEGAWGTARWAVDHEPRFERVRSAERLVHAVTAALTAVPRLALASPVVGELQAKHDEAVAALRLALVWWGDGYPGVKGERKYDYLRATLAALTGEEGRDG